MIYRQKHGYENLQKEIFEGCGDFGIPEISPTNYTECNFIPFNYAKTRKEKSGIGIHFFIDDYQFIRLWNAPDKYLSVLSGYKYIMSPDFSTYTDFPKAMQIYNHYRKHWLGAYWQKNGIDVIPTISWSDEPSFEWCFDGEPVGGTVAVSSVGCMNSTKRKELFLDGYREMIKRLKPTTIIFHGKVPDECDGNIIQIPAYQDKFKKVK